MKDFQFKWDNQIETLALKMDNCKISHSLREYAKTNTMLNRMKLALKNKLPGLTTFISKCNNFQTPIININGKEFKMTYAVRRFIVYSYAMLPVMMNRKGFMRNYIFWSLLFCRENLNIRNYKFHQPPPPTETSNKK